MDARVDSDAIFYVLKIKYADTLRRLILKPHPGISGGVNIFSYHELEEKIRNLFPISSSAQLVLTYKDKENDVVTISQDEDLEDALVIQGLNPLRIDVSGCEEDGGSTTKKGKRKAVLGEAPSSPVVDTSPPFVDDLQKALLSTIDSLKNVASGQLNHLISGKLVQDDQKFSAKSLSELLQGFAGAHGKDPKVKTDSGRDRGFESFNKGAGSSSEPFSDSTADFSQFTRAQTGPNPTFQSLSQDHGQHRTDGMVHHGVECDLCGVVPIVGARYKSNKKENYDLCANCFSFSQGVEADYTRYDQPIKYSGGQFGAFRGNRMPRSPFFQPNMFGRSACGNRGGFHGRHSRCNPRAAFNHNNAFGKLDCRFVKDVTIFDGTELAPGTLFIKIWRLRNSGSLPWPQDTQLIHVGGDELGSVPVSPLELPEAGLLPDGEIEVSVDLAAPEKPGRYISYWRLMGPSGVKFGHRVWVSIQVVTKDEQSPHILESLIVETENNQRYMNDQDREDVAAEYEKVIEGQSAGNFSYSNVLSEGNVQMPSAPVLTVAGGEYRKIQNDGEKLSPENHVNENANSENSELGAFSLVDILKAVIVDAPVIPKALSNPPSEATSFETELLPAGWEVESTVKPEPTASIEEALLNQLAAMGFTERSLNQELLENHNYNLQTVLDELFSAAEWEPLLDELQEMGFTDTDLNRRLMLKNKGNLKGAVKELVQMYKNSAGKDKEKV